MRVFGVGGGIGAVADFELGPGLRRGDGGCAGVTGVARRDTCCEALMRN